ncbi:unnamed protein product, partial [Hapterophycus canaliculatus]
MGAPSFDGVETGTAMSTGQTQRPVSALSAERDDGHHHHFYSSSAAARKITTNNISIMQSLMISGLELALTLGNALDKDAFEFESGSDLIFGGSALMEAVGLLFAIWMGLTAIFRPAGTDDDAVGSGVPAMVLWEGISTGSRKLTSKALYRGIWAQTFVFLLTLTICWSAQPGTRPDWAFENSTGQAVGLALLVAWAVLCTLACAFVRGGAGIVLALHLGIIPIGVEAYEAVLLFTSDSS